MKTQYFTATSLDGFIATEDDSLEWLFTLGDVADTDYPEFIKQVGALAMGSATYEWMLRNTKQVAEQAGSAWPFIQIGSVTLGRGKPLFPRRATSPAWKLLSVRQVGSGFAELHYELPSAVTKSTLNRRNEG